MGAALEALIPFAAGHELIRQRRRDLTLIGPISDILFDQLVGAGCVARIAAAWVGNVSAGLGHNFRRAVEQGQPRAIEVHDHSNLSIALALHAAALGVPYLPARSLLGTDLLESNPDFRQAPDPWTGDPLVLVPALAPDVTIVHVQRADAEGRAHVWGTLGVTREAVFAARQVIVVAEEIWPRERILSDPGLVLAPELKVAAVVHEPFGAFPSPVQGCYGRHHDSYQRYHEESRRPEGFQAWLERWVLGVPDRRGYLDRLGPEILGGVRSRAPRLSEPLDYGA
jgi:glutaconate CoA-transferase subunit A